MLLSRQPTRIRAFSSRIPADGSLFLLLLEACRDSFAKTDSHPCMFVPHPCGPVSFSCLSKRKKPKRRTPRSSPVCGHPALRRRDRAAGFVDGTSMCRNERARIVRAPLRADPPPARRTATGTRKSGALLRAEVRKHGSERAQKRRAGVGEARPCRCRSDFSRDALSQSRRKASRLKSLLQRAGSRSNDPQGCIGGSPSCVQQREWRRRRVDTGRAQGALLRVLLLRRSALLFRVPFSDGGRWTIGPKGERDGSRSLRRQRRDALSAQPATAREPAGQDARRASLQGYPFLGLPFFGQAKKGNRPAGMRDEPTGTWVGRRERSRAALQEQQPGARQSVLKQPSPAKRERAKRVLNE